MIPFLESQTKSHLTALMFVVVLPENVKSWCEYGKNMCIVLCSTISMLIHFHLELVEISCFMSEHLTVACFQCSCLHFQQQINFPEKVIICSDFDVIPCCSLAAAPLCQLSSLSSWMTKFKHFVAPFVHINNPPPSLPTLITFNLEFSLSNTFSPFLALTPRITPPPLNPLLPPQEDLMGAQEYKFPFIPVAGADDTASLYPTDWRALWCRFTVYGSHSGAAAHLEWSTLTENRGQPWPKQV